MMKMLFNLYRVKVGGKWSNPFEYFDYINSYYCYFRTHKISNKTRRRMENAVLYRTKNFCYLFIFRHVCIKGKGGRWKYYNLSNLWNFIINFMSKPIYPIMRFVWIVNSYWFNNTFEWYKKSLLFLFNCVTLAALAD